MERYGTGIFLGAGRDKHFGFSVEVRYADKNMAESFNCLPTTGRLPEKENEVAVSSLVLEASGSYTKDWGRSHADVGSKSNAETIQDRYVPDMWILAGG